MMTQTSQPERSIEEGRTFSTDTNDDCYNTRKEAGGSKRGSSLHCLRSSSVAKYRARPSRRFEHEKLGLLGEASLALLGSLCLSECGRCRCLRVSIQRSPSVRPCCLSTEVEEEPPRGRIGGEPPICSLLPLSRAKIQACLYRRR